MTLAQNAGRSHSIKIDNGCFERVEELKYLETTLTYQNSIQEEVYCRLKSGNVCYLSVQNPSSSSFLPKNTKIKIYITLIFPVVLYRRETLSLTFREERRLRVFEKRVLRRIFGPQSYEVTGAWRKLPIEELNYLYSSPNIFPVIKLRTMRWAGHVAHMRKRRGVYRVLVGNLRERDHFEDPRIDGSIIYDGSSGSGMWGLGLDRCGSG